MQRRTAVKYLFVVAAGSAILPSCLYKKDKVSLPLRHLNINVEQEKLLGEFAETIIPAGAAPGARDTYAHLFVLRMVDDCFEEQKQQTFIKGLNEIDRITSEKFGNTFLQCNRQQRDETVSLIENKKTSADAIDFYGTMKTLTIQGYLTSKPVLGDIFKYELVPGRFNGFFPVKAIIHPA